MKSNLIWLSTLGIAFAVGLFLWLTPTAQGSGARAPAATRSVAPPPTGADIGNCTGTPCKTIGYAILQSSSGDRINVASGWYTEHITMANGVSIYGQGWGTVVGTVITGNFSANQPTVYLPYVDASTVLSGVQVAGGGTGDPNTSTYGGGIRIYGGSPSIINTWLNNNTTSVGGGVCVGGGSPTFDNVPAWNNRALTGGGFYLTDLAVVTITSDYAGTNGTVYSNSAANNGGGFYMGSVTVTLSGLRIWSNSANAGGGIYVNTTGQNRIALSSSDIYSNVVTASGGGIYAYDSTNLQILNNWIRSNTASSDGGGVSLSQSSGLIKGNLIQGNTLTNPGSDGGGVYVLGRTTGLTIEGNRIDRNTAPDEGGGLAVTDQVTAVINANTFLTNTAKNGSGIRITGPGLETVTNNFVARNIVSGTATSPAGGLYISGMPLAKIINNTISDNDNTGMYLLSSAGIIIANNIISGNDDHGVERGDAAIYTFDYNDVWSNTGGNYANVGVGAHDLSVNPSFIASGNVITYYHIQTNSPVKKTGSLVQAPANDIDGEPRIDYTSMGADQIIFRLFLPLIMR